MKELYEKGAGGVKNSGAKKSATEAGSAKRFNQAYKVLVKPLITEKATKMGEQNKYAFVVDNNANKISVAKSIESLYGIKPERVNIINIKGKRVRSRRMMGKRKDWRKAIVALPKGKSINIYEGV